MNKLHNSRAALGLAGLLAAMLLPTAYAPAAEIAQTSKPLTKITFTLDFTYDGEYAPFFVALSKGYYKDAGLDVTIEPGQGSADAVKKVSVGIADAGSATATNLLLAASSDSSLPIVATGVYIPHAAFSIETLKSSNLTSMAKLKGKTLAQPPAGTIGIVDAMMQSAGLASGDISRVNLSPSILKQTLLSGKVDAAWVFGQVFADEQNNVNFIYARDYGIDPYGEVVIFNKNFVDAHPGAAKAFMVATLKGLKDTIADPQAGADAVANVAGSGGDYYLAEIKYLKRFWASPDIQKSGYLKMTVNGWNTTEDVNVKYLGQGKPLTSDAMKHLWTNLGE
jgi:NitT/TauT family transport system substrate-binding protein